MVLLHKTLYVLNMGLCRKERKMKRKGMKKAIACMTAVLTLGSAMTAYAGTWEEHTYDPLIQYTENEGITKGQSSLKTYSGFTDDRSQATLVGKDWKYKKDDGSYAVSEWVQDAEGKYYYVGEDGYTCSATNILPDEKRYYFDPQDGHMIQDSIVEICETGGSDVNFTLHEDGTWDYIPWDGFDLAALSATSYQYYGTDGANVLVGAIPGGTAGPDYSIGKYSIAEVKKNTDENGVPYIQLGDETYRAVSSSSWDKTSHTDALQEGGFNSAYHEFYTVYQRVK